MAETDFYPAQSLINERTLESIRDYGNFQVYRIGQLRVIPNINCYQGRLMKNITTVTLDAEDLPSEKQAVEIILGDNGTGAHGRNASISIDPELGLSSTVGYVNAAYNGTAVRTTFNPTTTTLNYLGTIIWYV